MGDCKKPSDDKTNESFTISRAGLVYNLNGEYKGKVYKCDKSLVFYKCEKHGDKYILTKEFKGNYIIVSKI